MTKAQNTARIQKWRKANPEKYRAHRVRWRKAHPVAYKEQYRRAKLKKMYGVTPESYEAMLAEQHGVCAICGRPPAKRRLSIDHQHVPGYKQLPPEEKKKYVRGLLCFQCNKYVIGRRNDPALFDTAAAYLRRYLKRSEQK